MKFISCNLERSDPTAFPEKRLRFPSYDYAPEAFLPQALSAQALSAQALPAFASKI